MDDRKLTVYNGRGGFQKIAAADSFTGELAGTGRILRRGQNHREMPTGAAYHHKRRNKNRPRGIVSITLKWIFCKVYSLRKVIAV